MIVTETDSQYLQDMVMDMDPLKSDPDPEPAPASPVAAGQPASPAEPGETTPADPAGGFRIDFGDGVMVTLTGIDGKEYLQQNPKTQAGVSYAVASGDLTRADLVIEGLNEVKVRQRHQSELALRSDGRTLLLKSMGKFTSEWKVISAEPKGGRLSYSLKVLERPAFKKISAGSLRTGVQKQGRSDRLSQASINKWLQEARRVKAAGDPPSVVILDNVQWQISGKDRNGKNVFKTLRFEP